MYILVLFIYAGIMSKGDSVALTSVPGFKTQAACEAAAKQAEGLVKSTLKDVRSMCVKEG